MRVYICTIVALLCTERENRPFPDKASQWPLPLQLLSAADAVDAINQLVLFVDREDIFLYNKLIQMKQLVGTIVDQSLGRGGMRCAPVVSGMANVW